MHGYKNYAAWQLAHIVDEKESIVAQSLEVLTFNPVRKVIDRKFASNYVWCTEKKFSSGLHGKNLFDIKNLLFHFFVSATVSEHSSNRDFSANKGCKRE